MSELSDALLPTPPLPVIRTFIQLLGCIFVKNKPHFLGSFRRGRSPQNVSKWVSFVSFLRQIQTVEIQFPFFFFKNLSQTFSPTLSTCHKTKFPNKIWAWKNGANISCHFPYLYTRYELPKPGTSKRRSRSL